jgi:hypothetical protein
MLNQKIRVWRKPAMRLYKYLLISDGIINSPTLFKENVFTEKYNHHKTNARAVRQHEVEVEYVNKFYTYINDPNITFMSFEYPNFGDYRTAYTIIDMDDIDNIVNSISKNKKEWSASHDTEGEKQDNIEETLARVKRFRDAGIFSISEGKIPDVSWIIKNKVRTGGYINQKAAEKLHNYILGNKPIIRLCDIHHCGHTFDNRKQFLKRLSPDDHKIIHDVTEPQNMVYRGKCIMIGNFYSTTLNCDCNPIKNSGNLECKYCTGTLLIDTKESIINLVNQIKSVNYYNLLK